jgi:nucleoside-diphosphate-sugar epimerase
MTFPDGLVGQSLKYQASKILAHQATKRFVKERNPHFTTVTLHPCYVQGPSLVQKSSETVNDVVGMLMMSLQSQKPLFQPMIVDVRDVADATVAALSADIEGNFTEFVLRGMKFNWDSVVAFVEEKFPSFPLKLEPPFDQSYIDMDTSRAVQILGVKWRSMEDIIGHTLDQQISLLDSKRVVTN